MKDCTKRWPANLLSLKMSFKSWELESSAFTLRPVSPSHKQRVCCTLWQAEISWFWKLTKISETGDEPQPSKKHRHEVPPKININFLTDAGKTKGALGFVVLAFLLPMFFLLEGLQYTLITFYTLYCLYPWFDSRLTLRFQRRLDIQQVCDLWVSSHPVAFAEVFFFFTSYPWENIWTSHVDLPQRCFLEWLEIELHRTRTLSLNINSQWRL